MFGLVCRFAPDYRPLSKKLIAAWNHWRHYPPGHCQVCGYNLTGNVSGICPECGTLIPEGTVPLNKTDHQNDETASPLDVNRQRLDDPSR